jgi:hypothetical protein
LLIFGYPIVARTFKSILPFFLSELEELEIDFPFFNPISTLALTDGVLIVENETFPSISPFWFWKRLTIIYLHLPTSITGIFKSPFTSGLAIFGTSIFAPTFKSIFQL